MVRAAQTMFRGPNFLNIAIPDAAAYLEAELAQIIRPHKLDLYRHDQNGAEGGEGSQSVRLGFVENDYWRHYDALREIIERVRAEYPDLILQQASAGGTRLDLLSAGLFHEHFSSDRACYPYVYRMASGLSVYLPPEILVTPNGMCGPRNQPDLLTMLRGVYALGNTPMIFNAMLPKSVEEFQPGVREKFLHYNRLYKTFIRPLLSTCRVYHHAPVNATGGVESGDWLAMEFISPDRRKGWATIIRLSNTGSDTYPFKPRGLDERAKYSATFDGTGKRKTFEGSVLMRDGLPIRLASEPLSELLLFEAQ